MTFGSPPTPVSLSSVAAGSSDGANSDSKANVASALTATTASAPTVHQHWHCRVHDGVAAGKCTLETRSTALRQYAAAYKLKGSRAKDGSSFVKKVIAHRRGIAAHAGTNRMATQHKNLRAR